MFGKSDTYVLMVPRGNAAREKELSAALKELPQVRAILSYTDNAGSVIPTEYVEKDTLSKLISEHYSRLVLSVKADLEGDAAFELVGGVRQIAESYYPGQWLLAGEGVSTCDMKETVTSDMAKVNLIAIAAVFIVLLLSFKSLSLPVILVLAIEAGIWINTAIPYFTNQSVFYISYLIITSIQLGATVDYAIRSQAEAAARQKIRSAILNLSDEEIQALVDRQMQSIDVQSQIENAAAEQMTSDAVQQQIAAEIEKQMASDAVQQKIDDEVAAQLAASDTQTLLESMINQQMQSDSVQQLINQNIEEQMASSEVQSLINQNISAQMASNEVRERISDEMDRQRQRQEYLDGVAQALEENGEHGEAYRALSDLREKLDDVQKFYDGLRDYADGVSDLLDGAQEMKDGTGEFRSETTNINDTIHDKIDDMIADKTGSEVALTSFIDPRNTEVDNVQFIITTHAIRVSAVHTEEAPQPESAGILDKIRNLFK